MEEKLLAERDVLAALLVIVRKGYAKQDVPYAAGAYAVAKQLGLERQLREAYMAAELKELDA